MIARRLMVLCIGVAVSAGCRDPGLERNPAVGTRLAVSQSSELGRYLTDSTGQALYALLSDREGESTCHDACATAWPPVPGTDPPAESSEPAVQPDLVGTLLRRDGRLQVTYAGRPLYFRQESRQDVAPERLVKDQFGTWSLLFPHGEPMAAPEP